MIWPRGKEKMKEWTGKMIGMYVNERVCKILKLSQRAVSWTYGKNIAEASGNHDVIHMGAGMFSKEKDEDK